MITTTCEKCGKSAFVRPRRNAMVCRDCYIADVPTIPEIQSRTRKAYALVTLLIERGWSADLARRVRPEDWASVAKQANVKPPSLEAQAAVLQALEVARPVEVCR